MGDGQNQQICVDERKTGTYADEKITNYNKNLAGDQNVFPALLGLRSLQVLEKKNCFSNYRCIKLVLICLPKSNFLEMKCHRKNGNRRVSGRCEDICERSLDLKIVYKHKASNAKEGETQERGSKAKKKEDDKRRDKKK